MSKFEQIKERYLQGMVTEAQLDTYVRLGVITPEQAQEIRDAKNPPVVEPEPEVSE